MNLLLKRLIRTSLILMILNFWTKRMFKFIQQKRLQFESYLNLFYCLKQFELKKIIDFFHQMILKSSKQKNHKMNW